MERRTMQSRTAVRASWGLGAVVLLVGLAAGMPSEDCRGFNTPGNFLITDQFNNRVIEIDRTGAVIWQFGNGPSDITASSIVGTNDAERVGDLTLMAGTGIPAGATTNCPSGCPDNRVLLVDRKGKIIWQYGAFGVSGSGADQLNTPVANWLLPSGNILITDQGNQRVIEVRRSDKGIDWQYGQNGVMGTGANQLNNPNSAQLLRNGNVLIADENNDRAIEVTHDTPSVLVATFTAKGTVSGMAFASRLDDGNTLLTDSNNSRIVEVDPSDTVVWEYFTNTRAGSNASPLPTRAVRLANGDTLIADQFNHQVIEVNPSKKIVASFGTLNMPGYTPNSSAGLNAPYSAYVIGDFTGLTPPETFDDQDNGKKPIPPGQVRSGHRGEGDENNQGDDGESDHKE